MFSEPYMAHNTRCWSPGYLDRQSAGTFATQRPGYEAQPITFKNLPALALAHSLTHLPPLSAKQVAIVTPVIQLFYEY